MFVDFSFSDLHVSKHEEIENYFIFPLDFLRANIDLKLLKRLQDFRTQLTDDNVKINKFNYIGFALNQVCMQNIKKRNCG